MSSRVSLSLMPMPLHEWIVSPPICVAAMPVEAVIAGSMPHSRRNRTYRLMVCVFPAPGSPVRNTFVPVFNMANASSCVMLEKDESFLLRRHAAELRIIGNRLLTGRTDHTVPVMRRRIDRIEFQRFGR